MRGAGRHRWTAEAGDDYSPVTDLVFTLFAVSILLLAVVGSNGTVREQTIRRLQGEKYAMAEALEARAPPASGAAEARALGRQVAELEDALAEARQRAATPSASRFELGTVRPERAAGFLQGESFREGNAVDLLIVLGRNRERIRDAGVNRLAFEIDVAPGLGGKVAAGADPEYEQSLAVARALVRRLRATAIPFSCVVALPFGKTRAAALADLGRGGGGGETLSDLEGLGNGPVDLSRSQAALARAAAAGNRITVVGERIPAAPCDTDRLLRGIDEWVAKPLP